MEDMDYSYSSIQNTTARETPETAFDAVLRLIVNIGWPPFSTRDDSRDWRFAPA
jgi:hypothetical protein